MLSFTYHFTESPFCSTFCGINSIFTDTVSGLVVSFGNIRSLIGSPIIPRINPIIKRKKETCKPFIVSLNLCELSGGTLVSIAANVGGYDVAGSRSNKQ